MSPFTKVVAFSVLQKFVVAGAVSCVCFTGRSGVYDIITPHYFNHPPGRLVPPDLIIVIISTICS